MSDKIKPGISQEKLAPPLAGRLPGHASHKVDYSQPVEFEFNGKRYPAFRGDTIASALWAAGVRVLGRSFKYHRPRGAFALTGGDSNTIVRVGDEPNARAGTTPVEPDMAVKSQNAWPSLEADLLSLTDLGSRFMPVGFYYKTFIRPKALWPMYEKVLRNAAGLGRVTTDIPDAYFDKKYDFADVLVVGGGPAGMSAALSAAESGARVMLLDETPYLGGHLLHERETVQTRESGEMAAYELAAQLADRVQAQANIRVELNTTAFGIYDHLWVGAVKERLGDWEIGGLGDGAAGQTERHAMQNFAGRLLKLRAKTLVIANGAFEQPLLFENNDLPGVMLGSAAQRLMHLYGVKPGQRAVVLSANRDGLQVALDLHHAGVEVATVVDLRAAPDADVSIKLAEAGIPLRADCIITKARGEGSLNSVILQQAEVGPGLGTVKLVPDTKEVVLCDLLVTSVGWTPAVGLLYQAQAKLGYDEQRAEFLPSDLPPNVYAAGRVNGTHTVLAELFEGELAGRNAAAKAGFGQPASDKLAKQVASLKNDEPGRTSDLIYVPGGKKSFISFDEDVSIKDLRDAVAEGYNSMELLKRYSTLSMGPSQGKYESMNTMALCAEANGWSIPDTGTTTSRPPFSPVPLGVLAGRVMEPVKYTPMHDWHVANGAKMMNAGLWKRPEHYGNPTAEVIGTRGALGLIDVSTLGKLQIKGPDVRPLLQRLYTNKWMQLPPGRARYGVMCNEEGIVTDDGVAACLDEENWYVTATTGGINALYELIEWYLQSGWSYKVHITNLTDTYAAMNFTGPRAREALQPLTDIDLSNEAFPYMGARRGMVAGVPAIILRIGFTGELGYEIHVPAGYGLYLWETLLDAGQAHGVMPFGVEAQRIMRLEKGHFIVGQDTDGLTDPLMADLEWAVKMDKEDFLGKPSLVRIQKKGVTQKLVGYEMIEPNVVPEEANQIVVPNPEWPIGLEIIGRVTSSRYSPTLRRSIGLCWLPVEQSDPGTEFTVRIQGELHQGRVATLPFYDPAGEKLKS